MRSGAGVVAGLGVRVMVLVAFTACGESGPLVTVYSPHGRDQLVIFEQGFEAANPGVDVQWVDMGSQEVLDRVRSERANPQGDVWFGGPEVFFSRAAAEGLLEPYRPAWASVIAPEARGLDDLYYGVYLTPAVITYNSDALAREEAPRDWDDILDPRWAGKVLIRDPVASGTMRTIFGMIMYRSLEETGDTAAGYEWLRRLDAQTKEYVLNPTLLYQKLARQEGLVTLWNLPDVLRVKAQGLPLDYVLPAGGTPVLVDAIAVIKGTRRPELAHAFVEYVGSREAQLMAARQSFRNITRTDVPTDSLPAWLVDVNRRLQPMDLDWNLLESQGREWIRYWDAHIRGQGGR
ncbi:MAG: extracellular solute-binding protein [Gemmatimonadota bacterium]|nr:MAG: extracellular solute-binding protein [Gemmatimonadota bacterium]